MRRSTVIAGAAVLVAAAAGFYFFGRADAHDLTNFRFVEIDKGDIQATVASTGKLRAVTTVQVGTQVSGQVSAIYADFNDRVKKGQLVARIDPTLLEQAVRDAEATVERSKAELENAQRTFDRNKQLYERKVLTESEYSTTQYQLAVAQANLKSAQVNLDRARRNLAYTSIYAPIDGIVVERNVDVGQTVAASLSAPQLFLIANDLTEMWILASVDESDIGTIAEGQAVRFTVQAYPNRTFAGTVRQVRLQSTVTENVVNYTVVIDVKNTDGKLLPGMTATVDFLVGAATDVFRVPNAALRFRPTADQIAKLGDSAAVAANGQRRDSTRATPNDTTRRRAQDAGGRNGASGGGATGLGTRSGRGGGMATLWYVDNAGRLTPIRVRTGVTDGKVTEVRSPDLKAGLKIVSGIVLSAPSSTSPFQQTSTPPGPGGPPRF
ncbi:MAG: efflux RND transporter periplasmic adaptor subunit [Gemmatimonadaceae bacterium]